MRSGFVHFSGVSVVTLLLALSGSPGVRAQDVDDPPRSSPAPVDLDRFTLPAPPAAPVDVSQVAPRRPAQASGGAPDMRLELVPPPAAPVDVSDVMLAGRIEAAVAAMTQAETPHGAAGTRLHKEREAIAAFYAARNYAPLWLDRTGWTPQAKAALARIERANDDALDLHGYTLPALKQGGPDERAQAEVRLSQAVVGYGRQASGGRVDPRSISPLITAKPQTAEVDAILETVSAAAEAGAALKAFNPPQKGYAELRAKLAQLRRETPAMAQTHIPPGRTLKVGMKDERVPLIRARFGLDAASAAHDSTELVYDARVASAVKDFQRGVGLPASGVLTARTIAALSGGRPARLEGEIIANMERWRWEPRDMGEDRIEVNVPDYALKVMHGDKVVHRARVIVGKPATPTPIFSNEVRYLIVNPYWNVPPSIIRKEMMPHLANDPDYLERQGYEVFHRRGRLVVRQPPGPRNALGRIKFMFPNEHSVYLHDTPARSLFKSAKRAFSHGCVRVEQPFELGEILLGKKHGWSKQRLERMVGGGEKTVHLPEPMQIHIEYFTAWVGDSGKLELRDDIYGYSHKLRAALGVEG
jgi:murein L,D-transpeptidase YcbB/YkuD